LRWGVLEKKKKKVKIVELQKFVKVTKGCTDKRNPGPNAKIGMRKEQKTRLKPTKTKCFLPDQSSIISNKSFLPWCVLLPIGYSH
jgi:hypothetical protein